MTRYLYSFVVWPDETRGFPKPMFDLFLMLNNRVEMEFTTDEFSRFRSTLQQHGLILREIERAPCTEPETVP